MRDLALARLTGARLHFLHLSTAGSLAMIRGAKASGPGGHGRGGAPPLHPHRRRGGVLRPGVQGQPAAAQLTPTWPPSRRRWPTGSSTPSPPTTPPTPRRPRRRPSTRPRPGMLGLETALALALTELDLPIERVLALAVVAAGRHRRARGEHGGPVAAGRPANLCVIDPAAKWVVDPAAMASRSRNTPVRRPGPAGPGPPHHPARRARGHRRGGPAVSAADRGPAGTPADDTDRRSGQAACSFSPTAPPSRARPSAGGTRSGRRRRPGEVVFNTTLTGYQEVLTDPSYAGQIICFTYPHIGNYGITAADNESRRAFCRGLIVRELAPRPSSWRSEQQPGRLPRTSSGCPAWPGSTPAA